MRPTDQFQRYSLTQKRAVAVAQRGPIRSFNHDGALITRHRIPTRSLPWHGLALILIAVLMLKVALFTSLGSELYGEKVAEFAQGGALAKATAWVLQADSVTVWLSTEVAAILR